MQSACKCVQGIYFRAGDQESRGVVSLDKLEPFICGSRSGVGGAVGGQWVTSRRRAECSEKAKNKQFVYKHKEFGNLRASVIVLCD